MLYRGNNVMDSACIVYGIDIHREMMLWERRHNKLFLCKHALFLW